MNPATSARAQKTRKRTRIQEANEERILDAALEIFSTWGFRGATVDQIAALARMTKPNLLYYFRRQEDIYLAVLNRTHEMWLKPLEHLSSDGDPAEELLVAGKEGVFLFDRRDANWERSQLAGGAAEFVGAGEIRAGKLPERLRRDRNGSAAPISE